VDTVGCGDAFVGAMLATLASGGPLDRAIMRGNAAGAIAATREGAMPSLPTASEIDALVATLGA
jgi:ribokinase